MNITPLSAALGAEVTGVDLANALTDQRLMELNSALDEFEVLFFRDQHLTPVSQQQLAGQFGELLEYPFVAGYADAPYVVPIVKHENETQNFGGLWHTDSTYLARPPALTLLYAHQIPPIGGDTLFASMTRAYQALSPGMQALLGDLTGVFSAEHSGGYEVREFRLNKNVDAPVQRAEHPIICRHPRSGKLALYVNAAHTERFANMTAAESAPILEYLYRHQQQPEFSYRFQWQVGSLAIWDNRTTQHNPLNDYHGHKRAMSRVMTRGEVPVGSKAG